MARRFLARLFMALGLAGSLLFAAPAMVSAYDPLAGACTGGGSASAVCQGRTTEDPVAGPNGVIMTATNIVAWVAGAAAVIFFVFGGIKYITAAGNPGEVQKAKDTLIYAAVGLVAIVLARSVIAFVLSKV